MLLFFFGCSLQSKYDTGESNYSFFLAKSAVEPVPVQKRKKEEKKNRTSKLNDADLEVGNVGYWNPNGRS